MKNTERVTLRPGDYTIVTGCDQQEVDRLRDAFVAAGARDDGNCDVERGSIGWDERDNEVWSYPGIADGFRGQVLTREEVLNATNAGNNNQEQEMTPAQRAGWKVGDRGVALDDATTFSPGSIIELFHDDGSTGPRFKLISGDCGFNLADGEAGAYLSLSCVNRTSNPTATTLREIADVLDAGGDPSEEFEHQDPIYGWQEPEDFHDFMDSIGRGWQVRRKPKTVRVSGEVSVEVMAAARISTDIHGDTGSMARALLSLVEDDHD